MSAPTEPDPRAHVERAATVLETDEDIRQALLSAAKGPARGAAIEPAPAPAQAARPASPFRPTARPPVPVLTVFDDGKADGEQIRLRGPRFVIGRTEGDLRFPLDGRMSARHVEITHQLVGGLHRWVVTDLQSTHGLFIRVSRTVLADKAEILVGNGRYRFDAPQAPAEATAAYDPAGPPADRTQGLDAAGFRPAVITELLGRDLGNRLLLVRDEYWIGADPSCAISRPDDPFCEARHARLSRGPRGHWHAEHRRTQNGLWLRVPQVAVESVAMFQVGEQRFKLKIG